jgi:hypothetical protein
MLINPSSLRITFSRLHSGILHVSDICHFPWTALPVYSPLVLRICKYGTHMCIRLPRLQVTHPSCIRSKLECPGLYHFVRRCSRQYQYLRHERNSCRFRRLTLEILLVYAGTYTRIVTVSMSKHLFLIFSRFLPSVRTKEVSKRVMLYTLGTLSFVCHHDRCSTAYRDWYAHIVSISRGSLTS